MALSPAHRFGQLLGNLLEEVVEPFLRAFAETHHLFLDSQKTIRRVRSGKTVSWEDDFGNSHSLDYVLEKNGTDDIKGTPVAFIEVAWRRYTKHSRNKAQEIQGAILPLEQRYHDSNPFLGVILAGVFTKGAIDQLQSNGFQVLYFPYNTLIQAFQEEGLIIRFDESTPDSTFEESAKTIETLHQDIRKRIIANLIEANRDKLNTFIESLHQRMARSIKQITIIPLYGNTNIFSSFIDAIGFLNSYSSKEGSGIFYKHLVRVVFSNGDNVEGSFEDAKKAKDFLEFVAKQ